MSRLKGPALVRVDVRPFFADLDVSNGSRIGVVTSLDYNADGELCINIHQKTFFRCLIGVTLCLERLPLGVPINDCGTTYTEVSTIRRVFQYRCRY